MDPRCAALLAAALWQLRDHDARLRLELALGGVDRDLRDCLVRVGLGSLAAGAELDRARERVVSTAMGAGLEPAAARRLGAQLCARLDELARDRVPVEVAGPLRTGLVAAAVRDQLARGERLELPTVVWAWAARYHPGAFVAARRAA